MLILVRNTHDWSIDKTKKVDFAEDLNCMIDCVNAKKFFEIEDWKWKLKIEIENRKLKLKIRNWNWNWNWKLKIENWKLKLIIEIEIEN